MVDLSRRSFLGSSSVLLFGGVAAPHIAFGQPVVEHPELIPEDDLFTCLTRTLDAAHSAGAQYAEISLDRSLGQSLIQRGAQKVTGVSVGTTDAINIGVRVLVSGCWGHASSNQVEDAELVRLAQSAVRQAEANAAAKPRDLPWGTQRGITGRYVTPGIDPFSITLEEKIDFLNSWRTTVLDYRHSQYAADLGDCNLGYVRAERGYVNSDGSRQYAVTYQCNGTLILQGTYKHLQPLSPAPALWCRGLHPQQGGWDVVRAARPHEQIPTLVEESAEASMIGMAPVDIGRYDIVCNAETIGLLLGRTIVRACELDRVLGYEANADGTSYLGPDPGKHLGTAVAASSVSISANRSLATGLATIPWDAEGMPVKVFDLIREGRLVDYFTNRELAPTLDAWYAKTGKPLGSNGCAVQANSGAFPLSGLPNIRIEPAATGGDDDALIANITKGYYLPTFKGISASFQCQDGYALGKAREIINGKLGNYVMLGIMFNTTELLKHTTAIGGPDTVTPIPFGYRKGEPAQSTACTIEAVPMAFTDVPVIDPSRKG